MEEKQEDSATSEEEALLDRALSIHRTAIVMNAALTDILDRYPDDFELALTVSDVRRIREQGKIAVLLGMQAGQFLGGSVRTRGEVQNGRPGQARIHSRTEVEKEKPHLEEAQSAISVWSRWECSLESAKPYGNPYHDVEVRVTFEGPDGQSLTGYAFWDGERIHRISFMFPKPGGWTWKTDCSHTEDRGLHGRSGTVQVTPYEGPNPLLRRGYLEVSASREFLCHADGTPFLWIGDTSWLGGVRATQPEWCSYVEDRKRKGFTVLLLGSGVVGAPQDAWDRSGDAVFLSAGEAWNPVFWRRYHRKIEYANRRGLLVVVTGMINRLNQLGAGDENVLRFVRNLAARLAGNFVVFSPDQDWYGGPLELAHRAGAEIEGAAPLHLITQHTKRRLDWTQEYHDQEYLDFCGMQTGPGPVPEWRDWCPIDVGVSSRFTVEALSSLYSREPKKPVVNLEGTYDEGGGWSVMARRGG